MHISKYFTLEEMTVTGHHVGNMPDAESSMRLVRLCADHLDALRERFGPLRVTSGYRSPELNMLIAGSARDSAHCYGCAADIQSIDGHTPREMVLWVRDESGLDYDQVIDELRGCSAWLHYGVLRPGREHAPRRQALQMRDGKYTVLP
jgi:zinc D-Ala-D-Ala carboxypeptidase